MTDINFKIGDSVNWLINGKVAVSNWIIVGGGFSGKVWIEHPESTEEDNARLLVSIENIEAA